MKEGITPEAFAAIEDLLGEARKGRPARELARIEEALAIAAGARPIPADRHPLQAPRFYVPGLRARPWHDGSTLEAVAQLEASATRIAEELDALLATRGGFQPHRLDGDLVNREELWNAFYFKLEEQTFPANRAACPETAKVLSSLPRLGDMAFFSALSPGAHLRAHCGPTNLRLGIHLGLVVPDGCRFRVGEEVRAWERGTCLVFDDSFEHEVWNEGRGTRIVLLVDMWHPDLTDFEIEFLLQARDLIGSPAAAPASTAAAPLLA